MMVTQTDVSLPDLCGAVIGVNLEEMPQRLHGCRRALHIGVVYHDVTWCRGAEL